MIAALLFLTNNDQLTPRMKLYRDTIGEIIFWTASAVGLVLYFFSAPAGLPWNGLTQVALAYAGQVAELPEMPHPVWGYFIQVFGGHFVTLSAVSVALAAGLIGALVNRYLGWRVGTAAALAWLFLPGVWYRAISGTYGAFWTFGVVLAIWLANVVFLLATRRARRMAANAGVENAQKVLQGAEKLSWRARVNRIASWVIFGAAVLLTLVSVTSHDYDFGEVASVYARLMLDETGDRLVALNGVADDQMIWEAERRKPGSSVRLIALRNDDAYRTQFVARVRHDWPGETNLWAAAQVGPAAFADLALKRHSERFYLMTGASTTPEQWAVRWEAMKPYLKSSDPFVPVMCRAFAFEANTLGNRLQDEGKQKEAWELYWRVLEEVDRNNVSAVVNLSEMLRRGYKADAQKRKRVEDEMAKLRKGLADRQTVKIAQTMVAACGPVRPDAEAMSEFQTEIRKRLEELKRQGVKLEMSPELKTLVEWNNEMVAAADRGDMKEAGRLARGILSKPAWRSFIPANAVMGAVMAAEGDYVASEAFYETAVTGREKPPAVTFNDYADTLMHLGKYEKAEKYARLAVAQTSEKAWVARLTLAEILRGAKKNPEEVQTLIKGVLRHAPEKARAEIRKEFPEIR